MEISYTFYERYIGTRELGGLHLVSETLVSEKTVNTMLYAAEVLYHQYGAGRTNDKGEQEGALIFVQWLTELKLIIDQAFLGETVSHVYLANPLELLIFFQSNPQATNEVYLMSDPFHTQFHDLIKNEVKRSFDDVLLKNWEQNGLMYAIVSDR